MHRQCVAYCMGPPEFSIEYNRSKQKQLFDAIKVKWNHKMHNDFYGSDASFSNHTEKKMNLHVCLHVKS